MFIHELKYAGLSCKDKITQIREAIRRNSCTGILISALDEVAWTLNLRGSDVHCNPVFVSYLLITEYSSTLYIIENKLSDEVKDYLTENEIKVRPYSTIEKDLKDFTGKLLLSANINAAVHAAACAHSLIEIAPSPVLFLKAIKNETEIEGFHRAMKRDGVAMVKFLRWLKAAVSTENETEISIDKKLYEFRAGQPHFNGISFDTIAGYKAHGAIVHYEATPETDIPLKPEGMLLLDSGAQYLDGTTDITRTIVLGALTKRRKNRLHISLKRIYPTLNGSISTWNLRNTTRCAGSPPYVESRNQLPAWNRPRCRLFSECTRRSSPIPHEPHAGLTCSRHDSNQRARYI